MINTTNYEEKASQNYSEVLLPHIVQNGHHQKVYKQ